MFQELIDAITKGVKSETITVRGKDYVTANQVFIPPKETTVELITVHSLTALAEYLNADIDQCRAHDLFIHVAEPTSVVLYKQMKGGNEEGDRHAWMKAVAPPSGFRFGTYMSQELFLVTMQQNFDIGGDFTTVINYVSGIQADNSLALTDDGLSQEAVFKKSSIKSERLKIDNPVRLAPFRTFAEIPQQISPFLLRFKQDDGEIGVALFEVDDRKWRNAARKDIHEFLYRAVPETVPIMF